MLADDHPTVLSGLAHTLAPISSVKIVGTSQNGSELCAALAKEPCDVVVSDYSMPGGQHSDGLTLFEYIQRHYPDVNIVALTAMDSPSVIQSLLAVGVSSILSKSDAIGHIITAIHASFSGGAYLSPIIDDIVRQLSSAGDVGHPLSPREHEVVRLFASGLTISEIAKRLNRSKQTISSQKIFAMRKLGVTNDADLIRYAIETQLVASIPKDR